MRIGEIWKSLQKTIDGQNQFVRLMKYIGDDHWLIDVWLSDESEDCSHWGFMSGKEIYENYIRISND